MEKNLNNFFTNMLVNVLINLTTDSKPEWGTMTPRQMLIHLIQSSKMMHFGNSIILIKEKHIKQSIAFLYSDKEIKKGLVVPKDIGLNFDKDSNQDIEELKKLEPDIVITQAHCEVCAVSLSEVEEIVNKHLNEKTKIKLWKVILGELNPKKLNNEEIKLFTFYLILPKQFQHDRVL